MNYAKHYKELIDKTILLDRKKGTVYYERHHVTPKCLGGSNEKSNLVLLTAKEHFVAHHLLSKIHKNVDKLQIAFFLMCTVKEGERRVKVSSIVYKNAQQGHAKNMSLISAGNAYCLGYKHSEQTKEIKSRQTSGKNNPMFGKPGGMLNKIHPTLFKNLVGLVADRLMVISYYGKNNGKHSWSCSCECGNIVIRTSSQIHSTRYKSKSCGCVSIEKFKYNRLGMKASEETKKRMSIANKGRVFTEKHRENIGKSNVLRGIRQRELRTNTLDEIE